MSASGRPAMAGSEPPLASPPPSTSTSAAPSLFPLSASSRSTPPMESKAPQWPSFWGATEGSPVSSSPLGLTETESEEDDSDEYTAGLAEQIAHSMLQEDEEDSSAAFMAEHSKVAWASQTPLSSSPQSILSGGGCWSRGYKKKENTKAYSPVSSSGVSSPPSPLAPAFQVKEDALDLLYAELMRLRMEDEMRAYDAAELSAGPHDAFFASRQLPAASQSSSLSPTCVQPKAWSRGSRSSFNSSTAENQILKSRNEQYVGMGSKLVNSSWSSQHQHQHQHHQHQHQHQQSLSNARSRTGGAWSSSAPYYHQPSSPSSHQHAVASGSGMRAVFLGNPGARESGGTGVFLPRRVGSRPDTRRKPACSTVLLPSRIVQALNLNIEDTLSCPVSALAAVAASRNRDTCTPKAYGATNASTNMVPPMSRTEWPPLHSQSQSQLQEVAPDVSLPLEWTY